MKPRFLTKAEWKESLCSTCSHKTICAAQFAIVTMCSSYKVAIPDRYKPEQLDIITELAKLNKGER